MSKKLYGLISGLIKAVEIAAITIVAYMKPTAMAAIIAAIGIAAKAIDEILLLFVEGESIAKGKK